MGIEHFDSHEEQQFYIEPGISDAMVEAEDKRLLWQRLMERGDKLHERSSNVENSVGQMALFVCAEIVHEAGTVMRRLSHDPAQR